MKYVVIRDCHGFMNRFWAKGTVIELKDGEVPPHHFEPVAGAVQVVKEPEKPMALSTIAATQMPKTGMAAGLEDTGMTLRESITRPEARRRGRKPKE